VQERGLVMGFIVAMLLVAGFLLFLSGELEV
jgi:hypothetical protein